MFFHALIAALFFTLGNEVVSQQKLQENRLNIALIDVSKVLEFRYKQDIGIDANKKDFRSILNLIMSLVTQPVNDLPIYKELFRQALYYMNCN